MSSIARPDLNLLRADLDSLLARALALGLQHGRLPNAVSDVLMAYLRMRGLAYAQQYRTGIAVGRERLERGIRQALICVDIGLEQEAGGDVEVAISILEKGRFEELRKRGWELAFGRLTEMVQQSRGFQEQPELRFLLEEQVAVDRWRRIVPETWTIQADEEDQIDPRSEYEEFVALQTRMRFLQSLPSGRLDRLAKSAAAGMTFAELLRSLIVALALDREELTAGRKVEARFQACFVDGALGEEYRQKVLSMVAEQANRIFADPKRRDQIVDEVGAEIARLAPPDAAADCAPDSDPNRQRDFSFQKGAHR